MISEKEKKIILSLARQFEVKEIYLFGSSLDEGKPANDIDLAIRGLAAERFFDFYGKLLRHLSRPVDLVDLAKNTRFTRLVEKRAVKLNE